MIRNYVKTAARNLWRHRSYSINSILSLSVSLALCLLLVLVLYGQWEYDRHHEHADRVYRVVSSPEPGWAYASSPAPLGPVLAEEHSGVVAATRVEPAEGHAVVDGTGISYEGLYVDPSFFRLFARPLLVGDARSLQEPFQVFVTEEWAKRALGSSRPVGRSLRLDGIGPVTVAGIIGEPKGPTHLPADVILSFATRSSLQEEMASSWTDGLSRFYNYVLLKPGTAPESLQSTFASVRARHYPDAGENEYAFDLQKVTDIALGPLMNNDPALTHGVLPGLVGLFLGGLMLVVMVVAGFTFTNLSLARALERTKEVSVRKAMGARRSHVAGQFLVEAVLVAFVALALALALLAGLVPLFNRLVVAEMIDLQLSFQPIQEPTVMLLFVGVTLLIGLSAGLYPAWRLSRPQPMDLLRGTGRSSSPDVFGRSRIRRVLLGGQLFLSVILVVSSVLVYQQGQYLAGFDYGFDADRLVHVQAQNASPDVLEEEASSLPGVTSTAYIGPHLPAGGGVSLPSFGVSGRRDSLHAMVYYGDSRALLPTLGVNLVAGRHAGPSEAVINEEAVRHLGLETPAAAVGRTLRGDRMYQISGVMENFQARPVFSSITPVVLQTSGEEEGRTLLIRADPTRHDHILSRLKERWADLDPVHAFEGGTYRETLRDITSVFDDLLGLVGGTTLFALFIAGMGLLGIALYATRSRRREVGIRKALGATVAQVAGLLSKEFLLMSGVALAIGLPVSWLVNRLWLDLFAHRVEVGAGVFVLATAITLTVTLSTAGVHALRTAHTDPATTLRDE